MATGRAWSRRLNNVVSLRDAVLRDLFTNMTRLPGPGFRWFPAVEDWLWPPEQTEPEYIADFGPRIYQIESRSGRMDVGFRLYLPESVGANAQIRGPFTRGKWHDLTPHAGGLWEFTFDDVAPGAFYEFKYLGVDDQEHVVTDPMAYRYAKALDRRTNRFNHHALVPNLAFDMDAPIPKPTGALTIFECTLPGLLGRWQGGRYFPREGEARSFAERVKASGVIKRIKDQGYNAVMFPIQASVANLVNYDWKFSYLISGLGAIDTELGDWNEMKALVNAFHAEGILVIPDIILVHQVREASPRAIEQMRHRDNTPLWFDPTPHLHRDYQTWMLRLDDRIIRGHVIEMLVRFIQELKLGAYRFDYVDGLMLQYSKRENGPDYGKQLIFELADTLDVYGCRALCVSEAFETRHREAVARMTDVLYQPWVPCVALNASLRRRREKELINLDDAVDGLKRQTLLAPYKPLMTYSLSHDEASADKQVIKDRRLDDGDTVSAGAHFAQLVLNALKKLPETIDMPPEQRLDYVAVHVAMIESLGMFGGNFAHMNTGNFGDMLKLGTYDDKGGWPVVWDVSDHPDLDNWTNITGLPVDDVQARIKDHASLMADLRRLYVARTAIEFDERKPLTTVDFLGQHPKLPAIAFARRTTGHDANTMILAFNFSSEAVEPLKINLPPHLAGAWVKHLSLCEQRNAARPTAPCFISGLRWGEMNVVLPPHSMLILVRPDSSHNLPTDATHVRGDAPPTAGSESKAVRPASAGEHQVDAPPSDSQSSIAISAKASAPIGDIAERKAIGQRSIPADSLAKADSLASPASKSPGDRSLDGARRFDAAHDSHSPKF